MISPPIITVFGSSKVAPGTVAYHLAFETGRVLASAGFTICNGGYGGTMEASAKGAKEGGGHTIGVTTEEFPSTCNEWIDREIRVPTHQERMMKLIDLAGGYVVMQGGTGTLLEFIAVWEFVNKRLIPNKPVVFAGEFWDAVVGNIWNAIRKDGQELRPEWMIRAGTPAEVSAALRGLLVPGENGR